MNNIDIISASAGSGKTFRISEILEEGVVKGTVRSQAILATTFTNKSAAELQERVRVRLLSAGRVADAQQMTAARIGTVNSICGKLVGDFAFELGLSPQLSVLDEGASKLALHRAISAALTPEDELALGDLSERMPEFDWQKAVGQIVKLAHTNAVPLADLRSAAQTSWTECSKLFGESAETAESLDQTLAEALRQFLKQVEGGGDDKKVTLEAIKRTRWALERLEREHHLPWKDWIALSKVKAAKPSESILEPVREAAAAQDRHPRLHDDLKRAIDIVFAIAVRAMESYQQQKRELGVLDFVDQEGYALKLLSKPEVREQLAEELDLVLIDEFQDTSPIQMAIFLKLAEAAKRSVWVGDQKQTIYGFRDADPALMDAAIAEILCGQEPETLSKSYRSRPGLVDFTSDLFTPAFEQQGIPASRVKLDPSSRKEPDGLGAFIECWSLESKNQPDDAASLATATRDLLADESVTVRVRGKDKFVARKVRPGDVAILCRTNATCLDLANALATLGIRAVIPRQGLMSTLEGRATLAGLRLWVDGRDSLAAAELARLIDYAGREDDWLAAVLKNPGEQAFADLPCIAALKQHRVSEPHLGVIGIFDSVVEIVGLLELCQRWGEAEARLANMEALRSHVVKYINACAISGSGCTAAGLVAHFVLLEQEQIDSQGVNEDEQAVVVSTWHGAKGLEWPIVVLFPLTRKNPATRAMGVSVQTHGSKFDLSNPLAGRRIRYWPYPYHSNNNRTPFHDRLAEHEATKLAWEQAEREDLRLLYVGWTRARDRIVLAGREGKITEDLLQLLRDEKGPLVSEPDGPELHWTSKPVRLVTRRVKPSESHYEPPVPGVSYVTTGIRDYPPAFIQPSSSSAAASGSVTCAVHRIGQRVPLTGEPDWAMLGNAVHGFLCVDRPGLEPALRQSLLDKLLDRWQVASHVNASDLLQSADRFWNWIFAELPGATVCREWPLLQRDKAGTVVRGTLDLVLWATSGWVIIDHKTFPGTDAQAQKEAQDYAGQLKLYCDGLEAATGDKVIGTWLHLPIVGVALKMSFS